MSHPDQEQFEQLVVNGLEPLSRRKFLRTAGLVGMAATAAVSSGCSTLLGRHSAPKKLKYKHLKPEEVATLTKMTEVYLPTTQYGLPDSLRDVPTLENIDYMVGQMATQTRDLLGMGFWFLENRPLFSFQFSHFSSMKTKEARQYIHKLQQGNFVERGLITTAFSMIGLNYWRDPSTWDALHYWGPVSITRGVSRLGNAPLPKS